jgi:D-alanyl-lipoteichoic acid acyltransferase DltB (MBOAT superfamily)
MLFNSAEFLFAFLPVTLIVLFAFGQRNRRAGLLWLILASLFFYTWWDIRNLPILLFSVAFNYLLSDYLIVCTARGRPNRAGIFLGVCVNVALLVWFKYANFIVDNVNAVSGFELQLRQTILPLGISFFTFQQISYLVDGYNGKAPRCTPLQYTMVVTIFPHLIAGPIVRYQDIIPQFSEQRVFQFDVDRVGAGLTLFVAGLFKKMVFADSIATYANSAFDAASQGVVLTLTEAWVGALAYTCQLYFDFSGYSDMAIGLAWIVGIQFNANFNSPYKALSIIDFWRRWHISLSNFLRDYLYIPLGGNRSGPTRRYVNLLVTMLLGGLWHGANWTFLVWGGLHGAYLAVNHLWRSALAGWGYSKDESPLPKLAAGVLTFLCVVVAWVLFRSANIATAGSILKSMTGMNGVQLPDYLEGVLSFTKAWGWQFDGFTANVGIPRFYSVFGIGILLAIAFLTPNTHDWLNRWSPVIGLKQSRLRGVFARFLGDGWRPAPLWSAIGGVALGVCILSMTRVSQFIYFQF